MNLADYFEPVDFSRFTDGNPLGKYALGPVIEKSSERISDDAFQKLDAVILGVPVENGKPQKKGTSAPDKIRNELYRLAALAPNLNIADLGNLKPATSPKGTYLALRDVVEYLRELKVVAIILGGSQDLTLGIAEAFKNDRFFWLSVVDAVLDVKKGTETFDSTNYLTRLFKNLPNLFHFSLIGYQNHLVGEKLIHKTNGISEHLRLGQLRDDISQTEFLLRNSDVLSFDMGSIKYTEAPSSRQKNPNGLRGEEACQLARYAGLSPQLGTFGLFETGNEHPISASLAAEITWYFLEGLLHRKPWGERTVYKAEIDGLDHPVVFLHEPESGRWWFKVKSVSGEVCEIACSEEEYRKASENEIPGRWLKFIQEMDDLSK
jgi:arginase family enzyme